MALRKVGQFKGAFSDNTSAIHLGGQHSTAYYNRGFLYERLGDHVRARADFAKAYEISPELESTREKAEEYGLIE